MDVRIWLVLIEQGGIVENYEALDCSKFNSYHKYTIEEAIDGISSIGFHYIELTATRGWKEHISPTVDFEYLRSVKDRLNKADVAPFSMSGHCNLMDRERIGDFLESIKLAAFFGCTYIVTSVGEAHLKDNGIVSDEEAAENIRKAVPHLEENNLTLVLENHGEHATGQSVKKIVDLVDSRMY
jgi:sugar phosphate isomerase/epimerase